ncbi:MAG: 4Fe-4S binding protein [Deltaproteobacteria bacterium]|jgi:Pyruvate/2-oxoacid:ferredoxin oxidoreductase delta subunit|nr:4Fe-4S binding protein [Deltaproteobacteria bacterium]MBT4267839.1 4Fe-4S binding protein [Deltaproteobacteria bacterium]MBT4638240.1 4Fe-4S binding protein [Deltaproteobacteria bacterium]MBT6504212.1 4Fe-4S binding protein [Deltaproteobacteria bacterium]MBT7152438.1 4Fe-4S binding protein [Deltaproteobacteria bacterium]
MSQAVYQQLLEVMQKRGGAYAGLDVPEFFEMVEEMFNPDEAEVNNAMPRGPFTADTMAETMEKGRDAVEKVLESMANKGLCMAYKADDVQYYMSARFMPGILEFQFMAGTTTDRDKKIAKLIHAYEAVYDAKTPVKEGSFPLTRVITVDKTIETGNKIHTYDQVQTYIDNNDIIAVSECYCRHAALLRGEESHGMPNDVCMQLGAGAQFAIERLGARKLNKQEARELLDRAEDAGLIHMSQNSAEGIGFICNCDRWDCSPVTNALRHSKPGLYFNSGFDPLINADECTACETCIDRCPPEAMVLGEDDVPVINFDLCFGCAVCATGCPSEAITMTNKPEYVAPPGTAKEMIAALKASKA